MVCVSEHVKFYNKSHRLQKQLEINRKMANLTELKELSKDGMIPTNTMNRPLSKHIQRNK